MRYPLLMRILLLAALVVGCGSGSDDAGEENEPTMAEQFCAGWNSAMCDPDNEFSSTRCEAVDDACSDDELDQVLVYLECVDSSDWCDTGDATGCVFGSGHSDECDSAILD